MRWTVLMVVTAVVVGGCIEGRTTVSPNQDRLLRKKPKVFVADAKERQYPAEAPKAGKAMVRAEVDYQLKLINLVNLSEEEITSAEMWVNGKYVCFLPRMEMKIEKTVNFQILFDAEGKSFPVSLAVEPVRKVELLIGGKLYEVPLYLAD